MSVNVGVETSSAGAAPNPWTIPLASVVLPAPRLPISSTVAPRGSVCDRRSPRAMVSSSEAVRKTGTLLQGRRKIAEQIGSRQAFFGERGGAQFAGQSVQVDGGGDGLAGIFRKLAQKAGDHAREDIARAAGAHGGRAGGVDPNAPVGKSDQRALPLQHYPDPPLCGHPPRPAGAEGGGPGGINPTPPVGKSDQRPPPLQPSRAPPLCGQPARGGQ